MGFSSEEILNKFLDDLERERRRVRITKGITRFALVLLTSLILVSLLSHVYLNNVYFSVLKILAIIGVCSGFGKFLLPALLKKEERTELALELEKVSSGLGEDTLSAVLLASDLTRNEKEFGVSKALAEAHIDKVTRKLESLDLSPAVPKEEIKDYRKPLLAAFILSLIVLTSAPREFRNFLFSADVLPAREPYLLELADVKIEYRYPAYIKTPPQEIKGSTGDVKALKGTHVSFRATPLKGLKKGNLVVEKGNVIPLTFEEGEIKAEFTILSSGGFFIEDEGGKLRSKVFKVTSEEDNRPEISIKTPGGEVVEIEGQERLDIYYRAGDDFGLTKLTLAWRVKDDKSTRLVERTKEEAKSLEGKFTWDLSGVESAPGEVIEVRMDAYDNDTVSGPKVGVSNKIKVKLKNPRKKHGDVLTLAEKVLNELLDVLADEIENARLDEDYLESSNVDVSVAKKVQEGITGKVEKVLTSLNELIEKMKSDDFSDYTYFLGLSNMKVRIESLLYERRDPSFTAADSPRFDSLMTREVNEFEDDILFLDSMLKGERLRESLVYGKNALNKYNELSELLQKLKESGDGETKKEVEKKIEELRSLMSELAEKLSSISGDIYAGFLNPNAFETIDLQNKLDEIMSLAQSGKINEALNLLASLKTGLQDMIASLEGGFQSLSSASLSKEITKLNELISRMEGIEKEEKALKGKTENLKESLLKAPSKRDSLSDFVERERGKIRELKNMLTEAKAKVSPDTSESEALESYLLADRILHKADELEHWFQALEFGEALRQAEEIEEGTAGLKNPSKLGGERGLKEVERSEELAKEIRQDLERILKRGAGEEGIYRIAERQDEVEKETEELGDDIIKYQDDILLPPNVGEMLGESKGFMGSASRNLKGKEVSKAISDQEEAVKALSKAKGEAEGLLKKYQMSAKGMGPSVPLVLGGNQSEQGFSGVDTSYVEIPSAEESEVGGEFKESLLKALKDGSPEGYRELNKRYYERIIK